MGSASHLTRLVRLNGTVAQTKQEVSLVPFVCVLKRPQNQISYLYTRSLGNEVVLT